MDIIGPRQIELKVHGLTMEDHGRVPARIFANKLKQLVGALEAADAVANGTVIHTYILASMHMSEPTAVLSEVPLKEEVEFRSSAIPVFNDAVEGIKTNDMRVERLAPVVKKVGLLSSGAASKFGFAEVRTADATVVRIDSFLQKRAAQIRRSANERWFNGAAIGTFDGILDYVDNRGSLPQIKLTLTAGGKEIDCICRKEDIDTLGVALSQRVRVHGRAIYNGLSALPVRVEASSIEPIKRDPDFTRWKGSFSPFAADSWEGNE